MARASSSVSARYSRHNFSAAAPGSFSKAGKTTIFTRKSVHARGLFQRGSRTGPQPLDTLLAHGPGPPVVPCGNSELSIVRPISWDERFLRTRPRHLRRILLGCI